MTITAFKTRAVPLALAAFMAVSALAIPGLSSSARAETLDTPSSTVLTSSSGQVWRTYVKAGEVYDATFVQEYLQTNHAWAFEVTYSLYGPTGTTPIVKTMDRDAPEGTTINFHYTATKDEVWEMRVQEEESALDNYGNPSVSAGATHHNRHSWNIKVDDDVKGRTWANGSHNLAQPSQAQNDPTGGDLDTADMTVYYLSDYGWLYKTDYHQYNGIYSRLKANNLGVLDMMASPEGVQTNKSIASGSATTSYQPSKFFVSPNSPSAATPYTIDPLVSSRLKYYKIFFDTPAADLPKTAKLFDDSTIIVSNAAAPLTPKVTNLTATRTASGIDYAWTQADHDGTSDLRIDTNNDGDYDDAVDVEQEITGTDGANTYSWDGKDGLGNQVDPNAGVKAEVRIKRFAEIHFLNTDAESRGGLTNYLVNAPASMSEEDRYKIYWDDTDLGDMGGTIIAPNAVLPTSQKDGTAGVNSNVRGGVHDLPGTNNTDGWGNDRVIQEWAFVKSNSMKEVVTPGISKLALTKTSKVREGKLGHGSVIDYTVKLTNTGSNEPDARIVDDLTKVLDDAEFGNDAKVLLSEDDSAPVVVPLVNNKLTWTGMLFKDQTATLTYSVKINATKTGDNILHNVALGCDSEECVPPPACENGDDLCGETTHKVPELKVEKTSKATGTKAGDTISYTVVATNDGPTDFTAENPAHVIDDLTAVLDDAEFNNDAVASPEGTLAYTEPRLTWVGPLAAGESVTLTYTVKAHDPLDGDDKAYNVVVATDDPTSVPDKAFTCKDVPTVACDETTDPFEKPGIPMVVAGGAALLLLAGGSAAMAGGMALRRRREEA